MFKFFKILGVFVALILLFLLWAIQAVDYTPYFESDYYSSSKSRLDSIANRKSVAYGKVLVGFGKRSITPSTGAQSDNPGAGAFKEIPLAGFGGREGAAATGIHDSLFVKCLALKVLDKTLVFVASDLLIMPPEVSKLSDSLIGNASGLTRENIFYSATHTHSSVGAWSEGVVGELFGGAYNQEVVQWLAKQVSSAVIDAINDVQPGQLGMENFHAREFVRNRLVGEHGTVNDDFLIIKAEQQNGKNMVIGSFDAHATTLGDWNMETSADYPGYWQRKLEKNGFDMAAFYAGSVGSHSYRSQGERFEKAKYLGEALADSVIKHVQQITMKDSIDLSYMTLKVDLPEFHIRISDGLRLRPMIARKLFPGVGDVYLQAAKIDNLLWATAPCDFSGETTLQYKNAMNVKGYKAMVSSFNGAYTGYIIPCKYYHLNEYESRLMNWFGPGINPMTNYFIGNMMEELTSEQ